MDYRAAEPNRSQTKLHRDNEQELIAVHFQGISAGKVWASSAPLACSTHTGSGLGRCLYPAEAVREDSTDQSKRFLYKHVKVWLYHQYFRSQLGGCLRLTWWPGSADWETLWIPGQTPGSWRSPRRGRRRGPRSPSPWFPRLALQGWDRYTAWESSTDTLFCSAFSEILL